MGVEKMHLSIRRTRPMNPMTSIRGGREQREQQLRTESFRSEVQLNQAPLEDHTEALQDNEGGLYRLSRFVPDGPWLGDKTGFTDNLFPLIFPPANRQHKES